MKKQIVLMVSLAGLLLTGCGQSVQEQRQEQQKVEAAKTAKIMGDVQQRPVGKRGAERSHASGL